MVHKYAAYNHQAFDIIRRFIYRLLNFYPAMLLSADSIGLEFGDVQD
jgi:hypothetical protein